MELNIQASKNIATGKYFIFIEECDRSQIKLINPEGKMLVVPAHIFEKPVSISRDNFEKCFTQAQLEEVEKQSKPKAVRKTVTKKTSSKVVKKGTKTGLGAEWDSDSLTFFRHFIDPLDAKQTFKINLGAGKIFEMSKEDFQMVFSDVILSVEYSIDGSYSMSEIPDRAQKYLKS